MGCNNIDLTTNVIYDWNGGISISAPAGSPPSPSSFSTVTGMTIEATDIQEPTATGSPLADINTGGQTGSLNNRYWTTRTSSQWFLIGGVNKSLAQFNTAVSDSGSVSSNVTYSAPTRTMGGYNATLGGTGTTAAFLTDARANWNNVLYGATNANNYIRVGFGAVVINPDPPPASHVTAMWTRGRR